MTINDDSNDGVDNGDENARWWWWWLPLIIDTRSPFSKSVPATITADIINHCYLGLKWCWYQWNSENVCLIITTYSKYLL